jgi:hypothetical protein
MKSFQILRKLNNFKNVKQFIKNQKFPGGNIVDSAVPKGTDLKKGAPKAKDLM